MKKLDTASSTTGEGRLRSSPTTSNQNRRAPIRQQSRSGPPHGDKDPSPHDDIHSLWLPWALRRPLRAPVMCATKSLSPRKNTIMHGWKIGIPSTKPSLPILTCRKLPHIVHVPTVPSHLSPCLQSAPTKLFCALGPAPQRAVEPESSRAAPAQLPRSDGLTLSTVCKIFGQQHQPTDRAMRQLGLTSLRSPRRLREAGEGNNPDISPPPDLAS